MTATTTDGAAIVTAAGGFVSFATDRTDYALNGLAQIIRFAVTSSGQSVLPTLRNAGFTVTRAAGGPEFSHPNVSSDTPLTFWESRSS